ncbi:MAG TPA: DUF1972 domain-containing protein [Catalimonadaceae bacterium]|nr:DUF1972 domain-containing protein [Catalimonadaceae bacterium]
MKIGILGSRGIPNHYGGFEQFAEIVSGIWASQGHEVYVYCSHDHPYGKGDLGMVHRILKFDPEFKLGTPGQFIYDANCIIDARKRGFDILLQLGYTSSAIWHWMMPKNTVLITNMDGLEWKRTKFSPLVRRAIRWFESLAAKHGGHLVADSVGIQDYLIQTYGKESTFIAYGASPVKENLPTHNLRKFDLEPNTYNLIIARLEPENHVEMILEGIRLSGQNRKTIVVGSTSTPAGIRWKSMFTESNFLFAGSIYDKSILDELRQHCYLYYHGHSVGGTNPSLLEAMAAGSLICANDNPFNRSVLEEDGLYFSSADQVAAYQIETIIENRSKIIQNLKEKISQKYTWEKIANDYLTCFQYAAKSSGK